MSGTIGGVSSMYTQGQLDQMKETEKLVRNTLYSHAKKPS
jgi:hypothetical protein